jgi:hypothetical protein
VSTSGRKLAKREKTMLMALGVIAIAALGFMFLAGGSDEPITVDDGTQPPRPASESPRPERPPITDGGFEGRDPFEPLVTADAGAQPPGDTGRPGGDGNGGAQEGQRVQLLDIYVSEGTRFATVDVNGREYTVTEGETFAGNFRLLSLRRRCGTFVFGDERFTLCIGQEVQK